jgi:hydrogenase maturation factor
MLCPGQDLVLTGWIALGGTAAIVRREEHRLKERYPYALIDRARAYEKQMSVAREARAITHFGTCAMHDLSQGGVLGALWEMAERADVGLEVDLRKIPVRQETIEICEYFDINPYYLYSAGALLTGTDQAEQMIRMLAGQGIPAVVIGRVTEGRERIIRNGEDVRYLDRPQQEEWYRVFEGKNPGEAK